MVRQRALLFERLEVTEAMRVFMSYRMSDSEKLRTRLERAENDLIAIQKATAEGVEALKLVEGDREPIRAEADKLKKEGEIAEAKLKGVE